MLPTDRPVLPAWVPLIRRGPREIQIGLDPGPGVRVTDAPDALLALLTLLNGDHSIAEIIDRAVDSDVGANDLWQLIDHLRSTGLVRSKVPLASDLHRVRVIGAGALGQAVALALLEAGLPNLQLVDGEPVDPVRYPSAGTKTSQAQALAHQLRHVIPANQRKPIPVQIGSHWEDPGLPAPQLTVIATDRLEPDRVIGRDYVQDGHPHLYLRPLLGGVVVGPYVRPGDTPCLNCLDRIRADADPHWPRLLSDLTGTRASVEPLLAHWGAATTVAQLLNRCERDDHGIARTVEMTALDCELRYRAWPLHPDCGCNWLP